MNCRRKNDRRAPRRHPLAGSLASAIGRDEVDILFQPQFASDSGALVGAEALARWRHDDHGILAGDELFRIASRSELTRSLSQHVFDAALLEAREWPAELRLSLNITAGDLADSGFVDLMAVSLGRSGFEPERLTLEITEQALVHDLVGSAERLQKLVDLGVKVALDDFGAGFCNFRYLKALPLHYLKLDRSMVEGIVEDARDLEVLRGIIAMASALNLGVIAEGVETQAQLSAIASEGCEYWQGFWGGKPVRAPEFRSIAIA